MDRTERMEKLYRSLSLDHEVAEEPPVLSPPFHPQPQSISNGNLAAGGAIPRLVQFFIYYESIGYYFNPPPPSPIASLSMGYGF